VRRHTELTWPLCPAKFSTELPPPERSVLRTLQKQIEKKKRITEGTRVGGRRDDTEHSLIIPVACGHVGSCFLFLIHYVRSATLVLRPIHIRWLLLPSPVFKCN
jgi:hypothetical protein